MALPNIEMTDEERQLLQRLRTLFADKGDTYEGAEFRKHFHEALMQGFCLACGRLKPCYCERDE